MKTRILKQTLLGLAFTGFLICQAGHVTANDLPTAPGSPIAGISFDDRPLMLPVQRNFQMAMLTASSELGRSCGRMEAYGWRMEDGEQDRVNQLFNNTVDRMRAQGFVVESKAPSSVSKDVTLFTADRTDKHLIFLWSAGEVGLVMVLCETSAPLSPIPEHLTRESEAAQPAVFPSHLPLAKTVRSSSKGGAEDRPVKLTPAGRPSHSTFSPVGDWVGNYTCGQGTTGATLHVSKIKGDQFEGEFHFYPTSKNPYVPKGRYTVFGEYDADTQRILINPGKWIDRPKDYYNTIMIGSFDPVAKSFSGYFQGITGCTSFEASNDSESAQAVTYKETGKKAATSPKKDKKPAAKKAKTVKKKTEATTTNVEASTASPAPARSSSIEPPVGIVVGAPTK